MTAIAAYDDGFDTLLVHRPRPRYPVRQNLTSDPISSWPGGGQTTSAFGVNRFPSWLLPTIDRMRELVMLPVGWDGHDGRPVEIDVAVFAVQFLWQTLEPDSPAPQIVPLSYGGVQLEWHEQGMDLEVEVEGPNRIFVSFEDHMSGEEFERAFSTDYTEVTRIMGILASRQQH